MESVRAGDFSRCQAVEHLDPEHLGGQIDYSDYLDISSLLCRGLGVAPGSASGPAAFSVAEAVAFRERGRAPVLILHESRPADLPGLLAACAVVTLRGGQTSHASVVARGLGIPAVTAIEGAELDSETPVLRLASARVIEPGDQVSVHGTSGSIHLGAFQETGPSRTRLAEFDAWLSGLLDDVPTAMGIWANTDDVESARAAIRRGASGIGLCRTEHMFLGERHSILRKAMTAVPGPELTTATERVYEVIRTELDSMLRIMDGRDIVVRLLDPPRHEFAADEPALFEHNPMLGIRGVRLAVVAPQTLACQLQAVLDTCARAIRDGVQVRCGLLIPMVSDLSEIRYVRSMLDDLRERDGIHADDVPIRLGAMIETPRAAMLASSLAPLVDFLSIGTNDLTALLWGLSRDDAEAELLRTYLDMDLIAASPFGDFDLEGLGPLLRKAVGDARAANPGIAIGVCGDQRIDAASIGYFKDIGVDYLSCSPPRLLRARLLAAQATSELRNAYQRGTR